MLRTLLTTSATIALLATGAFAQSGAKMPVAAHSEFSIFQPGDMGQRFKPTAGFYQASSDQLLADSLIGSTVFAGTAADAEAVGDVNDIVLAEDGTAEALLIGVGGFLGLGEKEVAIDFDRVSWMQREDGIHISTNATREEIENAPAFDRVQIDEGMRLRMQNVGALDTNDTVGTIPNTMGKPMDGSMDVATTTTPMTAGGQLVPLDTLSADELIGTPVDGSQGTRLGEIGDVLLSSDGQVNAYVIDVGGFLGIGEKPVALAADNLSITQDAEGALSIHTPFTKEQLETQVAYSAEAYEANPDQIVLR